MSTQLLIKHHNRILKDAKESIAEAIRCVRHARDYRYKESFNKYDAIIGECEIVLQRINELCEDED